MWWFRGTWKAFDLLLLFMNPLAGENGGIIILKYGNFMNEKHLHRGGAPVKRPHSSQSLFQRAEESPDLWLSQDCYAYVWSTFKDLAACLTVTTAAVGIFKDSWDGHVSLLVHHWATGRVAIHFSSRSFGEFGFLWCFMLSHVSNLFL